MERRRTDVDPRGGEGMPDDPKIRDEHLPLVPAVPLRVLHVLDVLQEFLPRPHPHVPAPERVKPHPFRPRNLGDETHSRISHVEADGLILPESVCTRHVADSACKSAGSRLGSPLGEWGQRERAWPVAEATRCSIDCPPPPPTFPFPSFACRRRGGEERGRAFMPGRPKCPCRKSASSCFTQCVNLSTVIVHMQNQNVHVSQE